jgi:hypothetical protein
MSIFVTEWITESPTGNPILSLLGASVSGGIVGSSILGIMNNLQLESSPTNLSSIVANLVLGAVAGFAAGLLFILGQVITLPDDPSLSKQLREEQLRNMIPFVAVISLIAGMTANKFFGKLKETKLPTEIPMGSSGRVI